VRRRELLFGAFLATASPRTICAQQPDRLKRLGVLAPLHEDDPEWIARLSGLREGLEKQGWSEGRNIRIDTRYAPGGVQIDAQAEDLVRLRPDVLVGYSVGVVSALRRKSSTIPMVFAGVSDAVGTGLVAEVTRPGGNLTGFTTYEASIAGKWLTMLKEIAPYLTRAAVIANPRTSNYDYWLGSVQSLANAVALNLVPTPIETAADIERALADFARAPNGGLIVPPDATTNVHRALIVTLAARHRLPAVYGFRFIVRGGGLMSYGTDRVEEMRQVATYVDRILRGERPGDLPVQGPSKFETAVNVKTANALGLQVPPALLIASDEVVE